MIYINNENKIKALEKKFNKENICIFLDFDKTITSNESEDSWTVSANKKIIGEDIYNELDKYCEKYEPIEFDYTIDAKQKEEYMQEWYIKSMELYYKYNLTEEKLIKCIEKGKIYLREGAKDFFYKLHENKIPVIILSAGIGNVVKKSLQNQGCYYDNMDIISNFIKFDNDEKMIRFSDNIIHSLNKNIDELDDLRIKKMINSKKYRIVIGDLVEDINMIGKYPDDKSLKIGFLNQNNEGNLEVYKENFDIVLTKENNFYDIENYIKI